jgi:hypothetical protein
MRIEEPDTANAATKALNLIGTCFNVPEWTSDYWNFGGYQLSTG